MIKTESPQQHQENLILSNQKPLQMKIISSKFRTNDGWPRADEDRPTAADEDDDQLQGMNAAEDRRRLAATI